MDFDATSLYPSAMWDEKSTYRKTGTGYVSTPDMKDEIVGNVDTQTFTQGSAILKVVYHYPLNLIFQQLPV